MEPFLTAPVAVCALAGAVLLLVAEYRRWPALARVSKPLAASAFTVFDLSVARDRFVAPAFGNRAWGLPLYFAAQLLIAFSVALVP